MIRLTKGACPKVLQENYLNWTQVLLDHKRNGTTPTDTELSKYRHSKIKEALLQETHSKCAYCESKFKHITYGDVEHIIPKVLDDTERFRWENLTLACDVCNTNKSSHTGLIDPYLQNPGEHLFFAGSLVLPKVTSPTGAITEKSLKLNRPALVERRTERIKGLVTLLQLYVSTSDPSLRKVLREDIEGAEVAPDTEHSAIALEYVRSQFRSMDSGST